jgi:hypothetical protein
MTDPDRRLRRLCTCVLFACLLFLAVSSALPR